MRTELKVVHQTGDRDIEWVSRAYEKECIDCDVKNFLFDIVDKYKWAHFVIARSGAVTVAEITSMGLPALLIPFPESTHGHQEENAKFLSEKEAGISVKQENFEPKVLFSILSKFIKNRNALMEMTTKTQDLNHSCSRLSVTKICREVVA